jgi:flagellar hook-associated protein 3 FlgL
MQDNLETLNALRDRAATGKQFQIASDDPESASAALGLRSSLRASQAYLATAQVTGDWMAATENALKQAVDLAKQAHQIALGGLSDSNDDEALGAMSAQIDSLLQQAIEVGNTRYNGDYIFSGFKTNTQPFTPVSGSPDSVSYDGNSGLMQRSLGPGQSVAANIPGDDIFTQLFAGLISARDALKGPDHSGLPAAVVALQTALDTVARERSNLGSRQQQVQAAITQSEETQLLLKSLISQKEDANMVEALSELRYQETTYQAVLEVGRRTLATLNLFDLLR